MLDRILDLLKREPVRVRAYAIGAAVVALLVTYGVVSGEEASVWLGVIAAVLGTSTVESARRRVKPTARPSDDETYG